MLRLLLMFHLVTSFAHVALATASSDSDISIAEVNEKMEGLEESELLVNRVRSLSSIQTRTLIKNTDTLVINDFLLLNKTHYKIPVFKNTKTLTIKHLLTVRNLGIYLRVFPELQHLVIVNSTFCNNFIHKSPAALAPNFQERLAQYQEEAFQDLIATFSKPLAAYVKKNKKLLSLSLPAKMVSHPHFQKALQEDFSDFAVLDAPSGSEAVLIRAPVILPTL